MLCSLRSWTVLLVAGALPGCSSGGAGYLTPGTLVTGSVTYQERIALPPDAEVEVWLVDASPAVAAAPVIAQTTVPATGRQVPISFELGYDPTRIDPSHDYAVKATIRVRGRVLFTSDAGIAVLTKGKPRQADLVLSQARSGSPLANSSWLLLDLGGTPILDGTAPTLEFQEGGRLSGKSSCNSFFGSVTVAADSIRIGEIGSTLMACPEPIMRQETAYLKALGDAARFSITDSSLVIHYAGSNKPLRFSPRGP